MFRGREQRRRSQPPRGQLRRVGAVDDVSLRVAYGEVVTLLGPNGAGKTTVVETLLGFRAPSSGSVRLHGLNPVRDHREVVVRTGALLQRGGVWFPMTPRQVLELTASYYDAPSRHERTPRRARPGELRPNPVATPQRWRTATHVTGARVARTTPRPRTRRTHHERVDPDGRQVIRDLVAAERDRGCALLVTTHELVEAERTSNRIVIMNRGHVVIDGTLDELSGAPEMIVELSAAVDAAQLATRLACVVKADGANRFRCATASSPERIAVLNDYLTSVGVTLLSLRTRASLEERYMDLIQEERREVRP